ncbi:hypothetical protein H5410_000570 [Solanum commersonii]|uniref:F-box associated beta-propeller type 3 domain-containing protein n=1 Tax=Solanum commersonii TaxID=4109 RepID=A0A9J6AW86_SOLCO|nr:hypothetical protein H5410_000570 [Solanum commersonii]
MCLNCISTFCNSLVSESDFVDIHSCCSMTRPGGTKFFLHERKAFYTEKFIEHDPAHLNCANSLFCVWEPLSIQLGAICILHLMLTLKKIKIIALCNASHWVYSYELIEVNGKLAVINYGAVSRYIDLWILTQTPEREWQRYIIRLPSIWNDIVPGPISSCSLVMGRLCSP